MSKNLEQYAATRKTPPSYIPDTPFYVLKNAADDKIIPDVNVADVLTLSSFAALFLNLNIREAPSVAETINILNKAIERLLITTNQEIFTLQEEHKAMELLADNSRSSSDPYDGCPGALGFNEQEIVDSGFEIDPTDEKISTSEFETSNPDNLRKTFSQKWKAILKWLEE